MKRIVFHHVPKSGGTYVLHALQIAGLKHRRTNWRPVDNGRARIYAHPDEFHSSHHVFRPDIFAPGASELYLTWVRDPVEMVYSSWHYWAQPDSILGHQRPYELYKRIGEHKTIEAYVDAMLASKKPFFPETAFTGLGGRISDFDFVGSAARMDESLTELFSLCGLQALENHPPPVNVSGATYTYRRAELQQRLKPEIEMVSPWL